MGKMSHSSAMSGGFTLSMESPPRRNYAPKSHYSKWPSREGSSMGQNLNNSGGRKSFFSWVIFQHLGKWQKYLKRWGLFWSCFNPILGGDMSVTNNLEKHHEIIPPFTWRNVCFCTSQRRCTWGDSARESQLLLGVVLRNSVELSPSQRNVLFWKDLEFNHLCMISSILYLTWPDF